MMGLNRIMSLPGAKQSFFIQIDTREVFAAESRQPILDLQQIMTSPIVDKFALPKKTGLDDAIVEMVTTTTSTYEIVIRLTDVSPYALVAIFDR
ncbi:MAG: hypothetical protein HC782_03355, partial [Gammaproteobacteria bacterium]|nr:hypothetical protein [Gammaproteobacteria bacterium]